VEREFIEFELDGAKIALHKSSMVHVQVGKGRKSAYCNKFSFNAKDVAQAVFHYNSINIGNGYKKRLICFSLNKPLLARAFS
jgi:hypothetical protein